MLSSLLTEKLRIGIAHYRQVGTLRTYTRSKHWMNFTALQVTSPLLSEYIWDARISLMPLLYLRVIDSFVGGVALAKLLCCPLCQSEVQSEQRR